MAKLKVIIDQLFSYFFFFFNKLTRRFSEMFGFHNVGKGSKTSKRKIIRYSNSNLNKRVLWLNVYFIKTIMLMVKKKKKRLGGQGWCERRYKAIFINHGNSKAFLDFPLTKRVLSLTYFLRTLFNSISLSLWLCLKHRCFPTL